MAVLIRNLDIIKIMQNNIGWRGEEKKSKI